MKVIALSIIFSLFGAAYSFPAEVKLDRLPMSKTKFDFLSLYKSQWELFGIPKKLRQAVDDAFTEQTESLMWGTMRMQLASNYDNIHEKIQQSAEFKFAGDYDKFLSELEENWGEKLREDILDFYKRQSEAMYFELEANPMAQAYLRQDYDRVTESQGRAVMSKISTELSAKYGTFAVSGAGIVGGGLMILAKKQLTNYVTKIVGRKLAGTALGKAAGTAIPVIGWAMLAWSAWDIYSMLAEAEDTVKNKIFEAYNNMYSEEVPLVYWEGMEGYVKDAYIFAYEQLSVNVSKGKSLAENPMIIALTRPLSKAEQRFFADRIAVIQEILTADGKKYTVDELLEKYGEFIRDAKLKDFDSFAAMLIESDGLPEVYPPKVNPSVSTSTLSSGDKSNITPPEKGERDSLLARGSVLSSSDISPDIQPTVSISADVKPKSPAFRIYEGH